MARALKRPAGQVARRIASVIQHPGRRSRGADGIRVPRRLGELVVGLMVLPIGAMVTMAVAATSASPALASQATTQAPSDRLLRFHHLPAAQGRVSIATGPPQLATLPPAPHLSPMRRSPTSAAAPAIPAASYPPGSVQAIITAAAKAHGVDPSWMIRTATCESTLRPNAYNPAGPYYGLFQFLMSTFLAHGGTNIWDPTQQANIAASMFASGDSSAWPVCSHA